MIQTNLENMFSWIIEMNDSKTNEISILLQEHFGGDKWYQNVWEMSARVWETLRFAKHVISNSNSSEHVSDSTIDFFLFMKCWQDAARNLQTNLSPWINNL